MDTAESIPRHLTRCKDSFSGCACRSTAAHCARTHTPTNTQPQTNTHTHKHISVLCCYTEQCNYVVCSGHVKVLVELDSFLELVNSTHIGLIQLWLLLRLCNTRLPSTDFK